MIYPFGRVATGVAIAVATHAASAQPYLNGDIITITRDLNVGTTYRVERIDPTDMSRSVLTTIDSSGSINFPQSAITYCPFRDAVLVKLANSKRILAIDSNGNTTEFTVANGDATVWGINNQAARGDGKVYIKSGDRIWYYDQNNQVQFLYDTDGTTPLDLNYGSIIGTGFYYHEPSNSLYCDLGVNFGLGSDEDYIYRIELSADGTTATNITRTQINLAPNNVDQLHTIGAGRTDSEVAYTVTTNDNNVGDYATMLNVNTFTKDRFLTAEFAVAQSGCGTTHSSNSLQVGVYSALAGGDGFGRLVYPVEIFCSGSNTVELWAYEYGDVDTSGLTADRTAAGSNYIVQNMLVVENTCPADINGDGILDNGDIITFVQLFLAGNIAVDINGDGILDNGDIITFVAAFLAGC